MKILLWIQPTWRLHIGNYFGALKKWLEMQKDNEVEFLIADFHANANYDTITSFWDSLRKLWCKRIKSQDGKTLHLFYQLAHSTSVAELARLPQYQTKEQTLHMLSYPLLMACDIIISNCDGVIVGDDQEPHMHFYREIARRNWYKEAVTIKSDTPRIMSIKDPSKKMSKSLGDDHCIYLDDSLSDLMRKIRSAPSTEDGLKNLELISSLYWIKFNRDRVLDSKNNLANTISVYNYKIK